MAHLDRLSAGGGVLKNGEGPKLSQSFKMYDAGCCRGYNIRRKRKERKRKFLV